MRFTFFKRSSKNKQSAPAWNANSDRLNLGCGAHFHPAWLNLDLSPASPQVMPHDLRAPLPFPDGRFAVVYHSHVLEHFERSFAPVFLAECFRVLKPGGILRVAVPDLEAIAQLYLENLRQAAAGDPSAASRHEWMTLELLDQLVRDRTGGGMLEFWSRDPIPEREFVVKRAGQEALRFIQALEEERRNPSPKAEPTPADPEQFRNSGELHKWMYDRFSLARLLTSVGFVDCVARAADESAIPEFNSYRLDTREDGSVRKPDSFFMEALRP